MATGRPSSALLQDSHHPFSAQPSASSSPSASSASCAPVHTAMPSPNFIAPSATSSVFRLSSSFRLSSARLLALLALAGWCLALLALSTLLSGSAFCSPAAQPRAAEGALGETEEFWEEEWEEEWEEGRNQECWDFKNGGRWCRLKECGTCRDSRRGEWRGRVRGRMCGDMQPGREAILVPQCMASLAPRYGSHCDRPALPPAPTSPPATALPAPAYPLLLLLRPHLPLCAPVPRPRPAHSARLSEERPEGGEQGEAGGEGKRGGEGRAVNREEEGMEKSGAKEVLQGQRKQSEAFRVVEIGDGEWEEGERAR
ncbi:hypothetical protein CLOM_g18769 [Closterium sp. NIES-68]|nr:hypothetical protein CLOM_g18769 [Closterium sp. NIES-68]